MTQEQPKRGKEIETALERNRGTLQSLNDIKTHWEAGKGVKISIQSLQTNGYAKEGGIEVKATSEDSCALLISTPLHMNIEVVEQQIKALETELAAL